MIALLIKSSIVIAVLLAFYKLFLEKESFFRNNRIYLLGGLFMAFALPFITLPQMVSEQGIVSEMIEKMSSGEKVEDTSVQTQISEINTDLTESNTTEVPALIENEKAEITHSSTTIPTVENTTQTAISTDEISPQSSYSLADWLLFAYGFGVIIFTLHLMTQIISLVLKIIKSEDKIEDEGAIIVNMSDTKEPFSFFNYIFINPESYDYETYEQILTHEKIHVQQRHTLDLLLSEIVTIILWFNPLVWLFRKEVEKNIEYQTDDLLLKENADEKEFYQMNLVRIATYNRPLTVTTNYNQSLIKQRLLKMNSQKSTPHSYWKYAFIFPMIFGILLVLNKPITVFAQPNEVPDAELVDDAPTEATTSTTKETTEITEITEKETKTPPPVIKKKDLSTKAGNQVCEALKLAAKAGDSKEVYRILKNDDLTCLIEDGSSPIEVELIKDAAVLQVALMRIDNSGSISYKIDGLQISWDKRPEDEKVNCIKLYDAAQEQDLEEVRRLLIEEDLSCLTMRDGSPSIYTNVLQNVVRLGGNVEIGNNNEVSISGLEMWFFFDEEEAKKSTSYNSNSFRNKEDFFSQTKDPDCCNIINAIKNSEFATVKRLVSEDNLNCVCESNYVDNNSYVTNFMTPLTAAARFGEFEITKFLIDTGAKIDFRSRGISPAFLAAAEGGNMDIVKLFLKKGAKIDYLDEGNGNALMSAARKGQTEVIEFLLQKGVDINIMNNGQGSALMCAARHGEIATIDLLLKKGADINAMNNGQGSALMCAARHGHNDVAELLIKKGANVNALNNGQGNAIMCAARHGHIDMIKLLLKNGADINSINEGQGNALMCAARHGHDDVATFLLKEGINVNSVNNGQGTALMCAARHGQNSMIKLLLKNGAKVNTVSQGQGTALICAIRHDNYSTVKLLLENGADAKIDTQGHGSALSNAHRKNDRKMIDLLEQRLRAQ